MAVRPPPSAAALLLLLTLSSTSLPTLATGYQDTDFAEQPAPEDTSTQYGNRTVRAKNPGLLIKPAGTEWLHNETLAAQYPIMFRSSSRVEDRHAGVINAAGHVAATLYPAADGRQAAICLLAKAGSSRWKRLMHKGQSGKLPRGGIHGRESPWLKGMSARQQAETIRSPDTLRIMFVRDPYARLLSGFLDKACHPAAGTWSSYINHQLGGPYTETPEDFAKFVRHMAGIRARGKSVDSHFMPMMDHCGLQRGMRYDLYLKAEEMDEWYPDVVSFLGLKKAVGSGFLKGGKDDAEFRECFYPLKGSTCRETSAYLDRYQEDRSTPRPGTVTDGLAAWQKIKTSGHAHGSDAKIASYYTEEVAELAYPMLKKDLEAFGYPKMAFP